MNKIILDNNKLETNTKDLIVEYQEAKDDFSIASLNIETLNEGSLYLEFKNISARLNINFNVNHRLDIIILVKGDNAKIKYNYNLNKSINVLKYNSISQINEMVEVNLNKEKIKFNYIFKSIGTNKENYDYVVKHNQPHTESNVINNCVNKEGTVNIQISGYIGKKINGCICNQNNRIINLTDNQCEIRPNLYIDTDDVDANHAALIGKFSDEEMFYLNSRGIDDVLATNLLIRGFLLSEILDETLKEEIKKDIDKYWR